MPTSTKRTARLSTSHKNSPKRPKLNPTRSPSAKGPNSTPATSTEPVQRPKKVIKYFFIDNILDHRVNADGIHEYLVHWENWDDSHNSWVPSYDMTDDSLIKRYEARKANGANDLFRKIAAKKSIVDALDDPKIRSELEKDMKLTEADKNLIEELKRLDTSSLRTKMDFTIDQIPSLQLTADESKQFEKLLGAFVMKIDEAIRKKRS